MVPAVGVSTLVLIGFFFLFEFRFVSRILVVYFVVLDLLFLLNFRLLARVLVNWLASSGRLARRLLIVDAGTVGQELAALIGTHPWSGLSLVGYVDDDPARSGSSVSGFPVLGTTAQMAYLVQRHDIDDVIVALPAREHEKISRVVLDLLPHPVQVQGGPRAVRDDLRPLPGGGLLGGAPDRDPRPGDHGLRPRHQAPLRPAHRRRRDAAPAAGDGGPGGGGQAGLPRARPSTAPGGWGRTGACSGCGSSAPWWSGPTSSPGTRRRATPAPPACGRVLRRWSLDELPNLWNVLSGEMSLVGPRPEQPWIVERYEPWQRKRLAAPPGMTGWWQVNGRSDLPLHENVEYDLYYVQNYSPLLDLIILFKTIPAVLRGRGAY